MNMSEQRALVARLDTVCGELACLRNELTAQDPERFARVAHQAIDAACDLRTRIAIMRADDEHAFTLTIEPADTPRRTYTLIFLLSEYPHIFAAYAAARSEAVQAMKAGCLSCAIVYPAHMHPDRYAHA